MFECWATWCGPCIAAIPHVNELHKKYYEKGLRVFGINVFEDGLDKVAGFVKSKGEGMAYPVAYTGKGSPFEKEWLIPAGVRGIPHAFIVKEGKIVMTAHPSQLTDAVIEILLSNDQKTEKIVAEMEAAKAGQQKFSTLKMDIRKAIAAKDAETLAAKIAELEKFDSSTSALPEMKLDLQLVRKDWPAAVKLIEEMPTDARLTTLPAKVLRQDSDYPAEVIKAIATKYATILDNPKLAANPLVHFSLASLQWKIGDKEVALASAKKAEESARNSQTGRPLPTAPFERFTQSLEAGTPPTMEEFIGWVRDEMKKTPAPTTDTPAAPAE